jgi:hypothetical protein
LHIIEEHILGWYDWARKTMNISLGWEQYVITEAAILIMGLTAAMLSGTPMGPTLVVAFATLLLINAVFFHIVPMLVNGGKFSPGVISGVFLFLPLAWHVYKTQTLSQNDMFWAVGLGIALILWPMFLLKLRGMAWFSGQPARAAASGGKRRRKR